MSEEEKGENELKSMLSQHLADHTGHKIKSEVYQQLSLSKKK